MPSRADALERRPVDLGGALHQHGAGAAVALRHLDQPQRVGGVGRAHHDHRVDVAGDRLHRFLAVGGGVADVLLVRPDDVGKARSQRSTIAAVSSTDSVVWVT